MDGGPVGPELLDVDWAKNPLRLTTVINCILEFLPFEDVKTFRIVCREWNSVAQLTLRNRAKIVFRTRTRFTPSNFIEEYISDAYLPDVPFTAFKFSRYWDPSGLHVLEFENFVRQWNSNIKRLEFQNTRLTKLVQSFFPYRLHKYNMNVMVDIMTNLVHLKVENNSSTRFIFSKRQLSSIPFLYLKGCDLIFENSKIAPAEISLENIQFFQNKTLLTEVAVNDFVDFSKCSKIYLASSPRCFLTCDLSKDIFSAPTTVEFSSVRVLNWTISNSKIRCCKLVKSYLSEKCEMQIEQLILQNCEIDFSFFPNTLKKLTLANNKYSSLGEINTISTLLNLKYLTLHFNDIQFLKLSQFKNCSQLLGVEIKAVSSCSFLNLHLCPKSVKALKLVLLDCVQFQFCSNCNRFDRYMLNVLVLENCIYKLAYELLRFITPKVLIISVAVHDKGVSIISFIQRNQNIQKIIVAIPVETSSSARCADKYYYQFDNSVQTSITKQEFERNLSIDKNEFVM